MESKVSLILRNFIPPENVKYFVNSKNITYWERAFTHDSINYRINYEKYEFLGDSIIGYAFNRYLYFDLGIKSPQLLNNLLNFYMSKDYQPIIAKKIGLTELGRFSPSIEPDAKFLKSFHEDIFEAFFGVFGNIGRKLNKSKPIAFKDPVDYTVDFFRWFFTKHDTLDINAGTPKKNIFTQFYYFFSGESNLTKISGFFNTKTKRYVFKPRYIEIISYYSPKMAREIAKVLKSKRESEMDFIEEVLEILFNSGYDLEWKKSEMERITFDDSLSELAKRNGYLRFILERNSKNSYDLLAQKIDPRTRTSISKLIKSYDDISFSDLKEDAIKVLYNEFE